MGEHILSADEVRYIIEKIGEGDNITQKVKSVAKMTQAAENTLFDYRKNGAKKGPLNVLLYQMLTTVSVSTVVKMVRDN